MINYERDRNGSAGFADASERKSAGLYSGQGAYIGTDAAGRHCCSDQMSAILLCGGARSLKGSVVIPWLVDGCMRGKQGHHHIIALDWKGQDTIIAGQQVHQGRHCIYFNPRRKAAPFHRINPLAHLIPDSPTLIPDALTTAASWIPETDRSCREGGGNLKAA